LQCSASAEWFGARRILGERCLFLASYSIICSESIFSANAFTLMEMRVIKTKFEAKKD
jgi:hypothetical protein